MASVYITFRSVTYAQRAEHALRLEGIASSLQRTPGWMEEQGCGYCLRVADRQGERAVGLLRRGGLPFRKVYRRAESGDFQEVAM